jgi:hypothetical protein
LIGAYKMQKFYVETMVANHERGDRLGTKRYQIKLDSTSKV